MSRRKFTTIDTEKTTTEVPTPPGWTPDAGALIALHLDNESLASFGIRASDTPICVRTSDVRAGDLAIAEMPDGTMICGLYRTAPGGRFTITNDQDANTFREGQPAGRVIAVLRDGKYIRPKVTLRPIATKRAGAPVATPDADEHARHVEYAERLAVLRTRLANLGDDITDSTERFQIEREIYDLEREQERDEWPEIIGEGGAR